jgi:signal transduction histidine kinase
MSRVPTAHEGAGILHSPGHRRPPLVRSSLRPPTPGHPRPIRRTLTVLLTIPVIALVGLWAYAAATTIGPYLASRNGQTDNRQLGAASQALLLQVTQERADTLAWQSAHGAIPRTTLDAQRATTDAALSALRTGLAGTKGVGGAPAQAAVTSLEHQLGQLPVIRSGVDSGQLTALTAFADYNSIMDVYFKYIRTQLVSDTSVTLYQQGEAVVASGQALEMIGREAAVVGGALAAGGTMTVAEYRQFVGALAEQRFLMQTINSPQSWQLAPNTFQPYYASSSYQRFSALEDQIANGGAGARLPIGPAAWQEEVGSTLKTYGEYERAASTSVTASSARVGHGILLRLILVGGAGLAAILIVAFLLLRFGNRLTRELTGFNSEVRTLAEERLPSLVRQLSLGQEVDVAAEAPPLTMQTRTLEVSRIADGFAAVQRTAVGAAVGQAELRKGVSLVFRSLARRNQSLLQRQLRMLDEMERGTEDPDALAQLFRLDHLTTRMRRQSEGLIILSGAAPGRRWSKPVPVIEVLRGASGEIEDYVRVDLAAESDDQVAGSAVADLTHLLAELIENAVLYSPPNTRVQVKTGWGASGFIVEIEDRGLGVPSAAMDELNQRLTQPPEFDLADSDQLGLLVVSRLAQRHGIKVTLRNSPYGGVAAIVLIPKELVVPAGMGSRRMELTTYSEAAPWTDLDPVRATASIRPPAAPSVRLAAPAGPAAPPDGATSGPHQGLPRRTRQASLAPQLRPAPPARDGAGERSAEQARSLISSVQRGWRSGRAVTEPAEGQPDDDQLDHGQAVPNETEEQR